MQGGATSPMAQKAENRAANHPTPPPARFPLERDRSSDKKSR